MPFAVFPVGGSRRFPPFIPTCRYQIMPSRLFLRVLVAKSKLLPSEILVATNYGMIRPAPGTCTTDKPSRTGLATDSTNPAMGFGFFSQAFGCFFTAHLAFSVDRKDRNSPQPLLAAVRSWDLRRREGVCCRSI